MAHNALRVKTSLKRAHHTLQVKNFPQRAHRALRVKNGGPFRHCPSLYNLLWAPMVEIHIHVEIHTYSGGARIFVFSISSRTTLGGGECGGNVLQISKIFEPQEM